MMTTNHLDDAIITCNWNRRWLGKWKSYSVVLGQHHLCRYRYLSIFLSPKYWQYWYQYILLQHFWPTHTPRCWKKCPTFFLLLATESRWHHQYQLRHPCFGTPSLSNGYFYHFHAVYYVVIDVTTGVKPSRQLPVWTSMMMYHIHIHIAIWDTQLTRVIIFIVKQPKKVQINIPKITDILAVTDTISIYRKIYIQNANNDMTLMISTLATFQYINPALIEWQHLLPLHHIIACK